MWGYLYPGTDATGTVRGLATPTPPQANATEFKKTISGGITGQTYKNWMLYYR